MSQSMTALFTSIDRNHIQEAVREAESKTSGEIVPFVVDHSDRYEAAEWRGGALLGALALAVFAFVHDFTSIWLSLNLAEIGILSLLAGGAGFLLVRLIPGLKRFFAGQLLIERRVAQRAAEAFITEEVFKTRERTGILIFLSLLERKVMVVGDSGINAKVKPDDWHEIVARIVNGISSGKPASGLIEGIRQCGVLLQKHGVAIRSDDQDELPDSLRTSDK